MVSNFLFRSWNQCCFQRLRLFIVRAAGPAVPEVNRPSVQLLLSCCLPEKKPHNRDGLYGGENAYTVERPSLSGRLGEMRDEKGKGWYEMPLCKENKGVE